MMPVEDAKITFSRGRNDVRYALLRHEVRPPGQANYETVRATAPAFAFLLEPLGLFDYHSRIVRELPGTRCGARFSPCISMELSFRRQSDDCLRNVTRQGIRLSPNIYHLWLLLFHYELPGTDAIGLGADIHRHLVSSRAL